LPNTVFSEAAITQVRGPRGGRERQKNAHTFFDRTFERLPNTVFSEAAITK
jgi:hypothetical protein